MFYYKKRKQGICASIVTVIFILNLFMNIIIPVSQVHAEEISLNSLQCGTMTSNKGFVIKNIDEITAEDYYVSFSYMYPSGQSMDGFRIWSSFNGKKYIGMSIIQTNSNLSVECEGGTKAVDKKIDADRWYHFLIHFKDDDTFELFIDQEAVMIGDSCIQSIIEAKRIKSIGYLGDVSTANHNGCGYFDNYKIYTGDSILFEEDFNNGTAIGWTMYTDTGTYPDSGLADPPVDCPLAPLDTITLKADRNQMVVDQTLEIGIKGILQDGTPDNLKRAAISCESSNANVVQVEGELDNSIIVKGLAPGNATVTVKVVLDGIEKETDMVVNVSEQAELYEILIEAEETKLLIGDTVEFGLKGLLTDGSIRDMDIEEVDIDISDTDVIEIEYKEGLPFVRGVGGGSAIVTVKSGEHEAQLEFRVISLDHIELTADRNIIFLDLDEQALLEVIAYLTDGSIADSNMVQVEIESSDENIAIVEWDGEIARVIPKNYGEVDITATATLNSITKTDSITISVSDIANVKTRSTIYTTEKVNAARENAKKYDWAKNTVASAVQNAEQYLEVGHDFLWNIVTPQSIPRSYAVNQPKGCLNCGKEIDKFGNYPYVADPVQDPWKIECPNCHMKFPTNDFKSYYESGLDEHGIFNPELANRDLLVNTLYPDRGEHWGVDDGYGYTHNNSDKYTFIAYYNHWHLWHGGFISQALNAFRDAYLFTGDMRYARAGVILLDRIADVYPEMDIWEHKIADGFLNSNGGSNTGKVVGSIWETGLAKHFLRAYDAFFPSIDDPEIIEYLSKKADDFNLSDLKRSGTGIRKNIEDGIVRQIYPAVRAAAIRGNNGMHQSTLAMAAVVLDTLPETKEWLDFNFQAGGFFANPWRVTGGNILATLVNDVDRDGHGNEGSPGYNRLWLGQYLELADILDGYDLYPEADLYKNIKFKKMFYSMHTLMMSSIYGANIGDTGSTGYPTDLLNKSQYIKAFDKFRDPIFAQLVYSLGQNSLKGVHTDIFSQNPKEIAEDMQAIIDRYGPLNPESENLTGFGFGVLRDGEPSEKPIDNKEIYNAYFADMEITDLSAPYKYFESNRSIQLEALEESHHITFEFEVPDTDVYDVNLLHWRAPTYGIYNVKIDGEFMEEVDFHGAQANTRSIGEIRLESGKHYITFEGIGKSDISSGYKMAVIQLILLEAGTGDEVDDESSSTQRDLWMYYGITGYHGHKDTLNIGLHAFNLDLAPDLGYPEYADETAHRREWVDNTVSHNTVVVDKSKQVTQNRAHAYPKHFDDSDMVKLIDVEAPKVYPKTELYKRSTAMIKVDDENSYYVDFFRVKGGNDHHFSFHGAEGEATAEGLNLVSQATGTYAGEDTEFGVRPSNDNGNSGFHWLKNVERDTNPSTKFSIDWNVKDTWGIYGKGISADTDVHLRLTMLGDVNEVALADGIPPRNRPGNPQSLRYMIAHRQGQDLNSLFTSVIEPYKAERYIKDIEEVSVTVDGKPADEDVKAVKVTLKDGRVDYIVSALDKEVLYTVDDKFTFQGFFGVYSERDGKPIYSYINDGTEIGQASDKKGNIDGTVVDFTKDLSIENQITIETDSEIKAEDIVGRYIYIENDGVRNAVYRIKGLELLENGRYRIDIGDTTLIRSFVDSTDFDKGYIYDVKEGARFTIPLSHIVKYDSEDPDDSELPDSVKKVIKLIEDLPELEELELSDKGKVEAARKAYDELEADDKALVENIGELKAAEERIAELEKGQEEEPELPDSVKKVIKLIEDLPELEELELSDKGKVEAARKAYNELEADDKALVENIGELKAAEERITELENIKKEDLKEKDPKEEDPKKKDPKKKLPKTGTGGSQITLIGLTLLILGVSLFILSKKRNTECVK